MDLSWCIICDNRIEDATSDGSLYCSNTCQVNDQASNAAQQFSSPVVHLKPSSQIRQVAKPVISKAKRPIAPSGAYPWIPLFRRRHGILIARRCQPVVAGSPATAGAYLTLQSRTVV
ncbi:hypothetical protein BDF14DRAFT_1745270 [Spinellus fusiger]|nr:hypothetical protein BDF14DRAFT_1745270 [Spinellus fusiger]